MLKNYIKLKNISNLLDKSQRISSFSSIFFLFVGIILIFFFSPDDYLQGNTVKIMYLHVPCAWMSLLIYFFLGILSIIYLSFRVVICNVFIKNIAPIGLTFSIITIITGSIWGKPIWGTWWAWDPRLTSFAILTSFYVAYISYDSANKYHKNSYDQSPIIIIIGLINLPIVKFSVELWSSLHQPPSVIRKNGPSMDNIMLLTLITMWLFFLNYTISLSALKIKKYLLERKIYSSGIRKV